MGPKSLNGLSQPDTMILKKLWLYIYLYDFLFFYKLIDSYRNFWKNEKFYEYLYFQKEFTGYLEGNGYVIERGHIKGIRLTLGD